MYTTMNPSTRSPRRPVRRLVAGAVLGTVRGAAPAVAQDKPGTTAAPFLALGIDARGAAMGSAQSATSAGAAALYWNPSALPLANRGARAVEGGDVVGLRPGDRDDRSGHMRTGTSQPIRSRARVSCRRR